ncbi:MAG: hypothetical protein WDA42_00910 [Candidatus Bathyarchaeia archaeon]
MHKVTTVIKNSTSVELKSLEPGTFFQWSQDTDVFRVCHKHESVALVGFSEEVIKNVVLTMRFSTGAFFTMMGDTLVSPITPVEPVTFIV